MAINDIFISYARKDVGFAKQVAKCLQSRGWSVWWDAEVGAGESFDEVIETNLLSARCVIVLWSKTSVTRRWVKNEARFAQERGLLVPVIIEDVDIPLEFSDLQSIYLGGWTGNEDESDERIFDLLRAINGKLTAKDDKAEEISSPSGVVTLEREGRLSAPIRVSPDVVRDFVLIREMNASWCPEMVALPSGGFLMGSSDLDVDAYDDEKPQHHVSIDYRFCIARFPITFAEYDVFAKATGRDYPGDSTWGRAKRPAINVTWEDANAYSEWLSLQTNQQYRLPSETEWEYACRAGTTTRYSCGDSLTVSDANFGGVVSKTTIVGSYKPNPWGIYDMHGNVCEWVLDTWHDNYLGAPTDGTPWIDETNTLRVIRGGCWSDYHRTSRSAVRGKEPMSQRYNFVGFRVVRPLKPLQ